MTFNNGDLAFELERIKSFEGIICSKSFDSNLDQPYIIDMGDSGYFYSEEKVRDQDYELAKKYLLDNGFHFKD